MAVGGPQLVISKQLFCCCWPNTAGVGLLSEWFCGDGGGTVEFVVVWRRTCALSICTCGERGESNAVSPELGFQRVDGWWSTAGKAAGDGEQ